MALTVQRLVRVFAYNGMSLVDPDAAMSADAVKEFYANIYPELNNAAIEGPKQTAGKMEYEFRRAVGTKGAALRERLQAHIDGDVDKPRGHAISGTQVEEVRLLANACNRLTVGRHHRDTLEHVTAPSEILPILP